MKPRTKYQAKVYALSKRVKPLGKKETRWITEECFTHYAYRLKSGQAVCMECGKEMENINADTAYVKCPHCKTHLKVETTRKRLHSDMLYASVMKTIENFQVERVFLARQSLCKGKKSHYHIQEISQRWLDEKGKITYIGLMRTSSYYIDSWLSNSNLEIRQSSYWVYDRIAEHSYPYPLEQILPILKRNGYEWNSHIYDRMHLFQALLNNTKIETLMKGRQYAMVDYFLKRGKDHIERYWNSLRIAIKHGYKIEDIGLWCDMIDLLRWFGKDTNNPKYICPNDLKAEHDKLSDKRSMVMQERNRREQEKERLRKEEERKKNKKDFYSLKNKFFGLQFCNGDIHVCVLESIEDFKLEGSKLHHCVYTNEYYAKADSLILSARINGEPIETIEVNLETMQIVQSRGLCNQNSSYHEEIVELVRNNMPLIEKRLTA